MDASSPARQPVTRERRSTTARDDAPKQQFLKYKLAMSASANAQFTLQ
jgi:hypothetical protein